MSYGTFIQDTAPGFPRDGRSQRGFAIRPARPDDCETIANLVRELAVYEKLERFAKATAEDFRVNLFGPRPHAEAIMAEVDGEPVGLALGFPTFSTFRGQPGFYLEDIFVRPEHRGKGIGKALLASIAKLARERGCGRLEWSVLDWNAPAIGFYRALGARPMDEWTVYRIDDGPLDRLAAQAPEDREGEAPAERSCTVRPREIEHPGEPSPSPARQEPRPPREPRPPVGGASGTDE